MKIILAKSAGFCYGVKRAVDLASEAPKSAPAPVQIVGDIVHNEFVMDQLKEAGIKKRKNIDEIKKGSFIVQPCSSIISSSTSSRIGIPFVPIKGIALCFLAISTAFR